MDLPAAFFLEPTGDKYRTQPNQRRQPCRELARFHGANLEVILDVVFNHTAKGNELGPTLSFKPSIILLTTDWFRARNAFTSTTGDR
jgi:pullulanase/glycogen debranching enzyme